MPGTRNRCIQPRSQGSWAEKRKAIQRRNTLKLKMKDMNKITNIWKLWCWIHWWRFIHAKVRNRQGKLQSNMFIPHYIASGSARAAEPTNWQTSATSGHDAQPIVEPRSAWIISWAVDCHPLKVSMMKSISWFQMYKRQPNQADTSNKKTLQVHKILSWNSQKHIQSSLIIVRQGSLDMHFVAFP